MLALLGGKERTQREWHALLAAAGFRLLAVHPLRSAHSLIEAVPARGVTHCSRSCQER